MSISYDSPEDQIRVWISWLLKLADDGKKWHTWLDTHVKILQRILNFMTGEYFTQSENVETKNIMRENELVKIMEEIVPDGDEEKSPQLHGEINRAQDGVNKSRQWMEDEEHSSEVSGTLRAINKIPWPIGVPWVPQQKIPLPEHKEKMMKFMNQIKNEATNYRLVYMRWRKIINRENKLT